MVIHLVIDIFKIQLQLCKQAGKEMLKGMPFILVRWAQNTSKLAPKNAKAVNAEHKIDQDTRTPALVPRMTMVCYIASPCININMLVASGAASPMLQDFLHCLSNLPLNNLGIGE